MKQILIKSYDLSTKKVTYTATDKWMDTLDGSVTTRSNTDLDSAGNTITKSVVVESDFFVLTSPSDVYGQTGDIIIDPAGSSTVVVNGNSSTIGTATISDVNASLNELINKDASVKGVANVYAVTGTNRARVSVVLNTKAEISVNNIDVTY